MSSILGRFFGRVGARLTPHLSDDTLARHISGELDSAALRQAAEHLAKCWPCASHREQLEKAAFRFVEFHQQMVARNLPSPDRRDQFLARLDQAAEQASERIVATPSLFRFSMSGGRWVAKNMNPVLASVAVVLIAVVTLFLIWQRNLEKVSANDLLERAAAWDVHPAKDTQQAAAHQGVIYQKVRIRTAHRTLERALYRDVEGRRRPKGQKGTGGHSGAAGDSDMAQLQNKLAVAGVDWEQPLSASSYKEWHNGLPDKTDVVVRNNGLLTLKTSTTSPGIVERESLTVRDDFRPVARTVDFRDSGTVEIAEVNYDILSWNAVNDALFEPLPGTLPPEARKPVSALPAPVSASVLPTNHQLDEAELKTLLELNHLNADTGEQIHASRSSKGIQIKGVVETNQRKQELMTKLSALPWVSLSILSIEELQARGDAGGVTSVRQYSVTGQPSPLAEYFRSQGRSRDDLSRISQSLLDASLAVGRESSALAEITQRFTVERLSKVGAAARGELLTRHTAALLKALDQQDEALHDLGISPPDSLLEMQAPISEAALQRLTSAARRNQDLCRALIAGGQSDETAVSILTDLRGSIGSMRAAVTDLRKQP